MHDEPEQSEGHRTAPGEDDRSTGAFASVAASLFAGVVSTLGAVVYAVIEGGDGTGRFVEAAAIAFALLGTASYAASALSIRQREKREERGDVTAASPELMLIDAVLRQEEHALRSLSPSATEPHP